MACSNSACTVAYFIGQRADDKSLWVYLETIGGGSGARAHKDGLDGVHVHTTNTSNLPVEALEIEYPLRLLRYELVPDSGGVGQYRGGMALRRVYQATHDCRVRVDTSRQRSRSWGLQGGGPGAHGRVEPGPGTEFTGDSAVLAAGQWFAIRDARRRRLRPARAPRSRRGGARPRPGRDQPRYGARGLRQARLAGLRFGSTRHAESPRRSPVVILSAAKDLTERSDTGRVAGVRSFATLRGDSARQDGGDLSLEVSVQHKKVDTSGCSWATEAELERP